MVPHGFYPGFLPFCTFEENISEASWGIEPRTFREIENRIGQRYILFSKTKQIIVVSGDEMQQIT
jgi:hypothetical protein